MTSGKGPATVRYNMIASEETSYNIALGGGNFKLACLKLAGIASLLPRKYNIAVPETPETAHKQVLQSEDSKRLWKWLEENQKKVYEGIQKFIEEEYKKGNLDF